jgi:hypothetical protein
MLETRPTAVAEGLVRRRGRLFEAVTARARERSAERERVRDS